MNVSADSSPKRMMAIDPGEKRIGVAISDISGTLTKPFKIIQHHSRERDVKEILQICRENNVGRIIVGFTQNEDGSLPPSGRNALKLADELRLKSEMVIDLWDEFETTKEAQKMLIKVNKPRKFRKANHDDIAAAIILQSYIDNRIPN